MDPQNALLANGAVFAGYQSVDDIFAHSRALFSGALFPLRLEGGPAVAVDNYPVNLAIVSVLLKAGDDLDRDALAQSGVVFADKTADTVELTDSARYFRPESESAFQDDLKNCQVFSTAEFAGLCALDRSRYAVGTIPTRLVWIPSKERYYAQFKYDGAWNTDLFFPGKQHLSMSTVSALKAHFMGAPLSGKLHHSPEDTLRVSMYRQTATPYFDLWIHTYQVRALDIYVQTVKAFIPPADTDLLDDLCMNVEWEL